jgi:hypothetical protein
MENREKESVGDENHDAVDRSGPSPVHGGRDWSAIIDDRFQGSAQLARGRRWDGLQEFERQMFGSLWMIGRDGATLRRSGQNTAGGRGIDIV